VSSSLRICVEHQDTAAMPMQTVRIGSPSQAPCRLTLDILQTIDPGAHPEEAGTAPGRGGDARAMVERVAQVVSRHKCRVSPRPDDPRDELGDEFVAALAHESANHRAGEPAGKVHSNGRRYIEVDGEIYPADRLAFLYVTGEWPVGAIEHIDGDLANDAWSNLRLAPRFRWIQTRI
jgi:hypothetical protein